MNRLLGLGTVIVSLSCASAPPTPGNLAKPTASAAPSPPPSAGAATAIVAGRTKLVPLISDGWEAFDALDLEAGKTLYVGASGQRWIAVEQKWPTAEDPENTRTVLTGAPSMAPETLVAARKRPDGSFLFLGESGASYFATGPLADLTTRRAPPEPLRAVAAARDAILAITRRDTLIRSTDGGVSFAPVATPKGESVPTLLAASSRGEALAFFSPGRFVASFDDGATFRTVQTDGVGATSVFTAASGALFVRGYAVSPTKPPGLAAVSSNVFALGRGTDGAPAFEKAKGSLARVFRPMADEDRLELAEGARNGHAVFEGLRYLEVRPTDEGELLRAVTLEKGTITHHPPIAATKGCTLTYVASGGNGVELMCTKLVETKKDSYEQLHLFRSTDFGKTFVADGALDAGESQKRVIASAAGHVLVLGACTKVHCTDDPLLVRPANTKGFVAAKIPKGFHIAQATQLRVGSGDRVVAVAVHDEDPGLFLLSSKDAGRTFTARPLPSSDDEPIDDVQEIAIDDKSGAVSLFGGDPIVRVTTRDEGATWERRELSFGADWLSVVGERGLATSGTPGVGYETLDSGATWGVVSLPTTTSVGGTIPIVCSEQGCMLGDIAIREGWELASAADVRPPKKPSAPQAAAAMHLPVLECQSDGKETDLGNVSEPIPEPSPSIALAAVAEDAKGALDIVSFPRAGKSLTRTSLLGAPKEASATRRIQSADGIVALRAIRFGEPKALVDVEIAWWVASSGKVHRATLAKSTMSPGKWGSVNATTAIVPGYGLHVRIAGGTDAATYLVRENGTATKVSLPPNFPALQRMVARRVGSQTMFLGVASDVPSADRFVSIAMLNDKSEAKTFVWGLWPRLPRGRTELALSTDQLVLTWPGSESIAPRHFALAVGAAGPEPPDATSIPLAKDLAACDAKATGTRAELAWTNGGRTPIVVKHAARTFLHATRATIARVGKSACASTLFAGAPAGLGNEWTILEGDGAHGLLIARGKTHVAVPLTCARSTAPLPAAFARTTGFVVE